MHLHWQQYIDFFTLPRQECLLVVGADTQKRLANGEASFPAPSKAQTPKNSLRKRKENVTESKPFFYFQNFKKAR